MTPAGHPSHDLPVDPAMACAAARALGWAGIVLPWMRLFRCGVFPVVELDVAVHRARLANGDGPCRDADTLAIWEWPQSARHVPESPVRLVGALFPAGTANSGLAPAATWRGFGPSAVVVAEPDRTAGAALLERQLHGVGLVVVGSDRRPECVVDAAAGSAARRRSVDRWLEETLYERALRLGVLPGRG